MSFRFSPSIAQSGLVLYLDASNTRSYPGSGTTWTDLSRSGYVGTLINGPIFNTSNSGSILFDGTNDLVEIPNSTSLASFTISTWFKMTGPGNTGGGANTFYNTLFGFSGGSRILVSTSANTSIQEGRILIQMGGANYFSSTGTTTTTNSWNNVVYTWRPNTATIYINGVAETPQSNSSVSFPNVTMYIGAYNKPITAYAMKGNIAQTSIYNRVLSDTEILQNYNTTKSRFL